MNSNGCWRCDREQNSAYTLFPDPLFPSDPWWICWQCVSERKAVKNRYLARTTLKIEVPEGDSL